MEHSEQQTPEDRERDGLVRRLRSIVEALDRGADLDGVMTPIATKTIINQAANEIEALKYAGRKLERNRESIRRFVRYAEEYPQDISGPLAEDFLPVLKRAGEAG